MKNKKSCFPFTVWDMTKSKKKCETFKDISLLITSSGASIIGLLGFKKSGYLIAIALALTVVEIFLVIRINRVLKNCEESANKEVLNLKGTIKKMENLNYDVQANNDELRGQNRLFQSYWVETSVVADAVAKANITKNPNQLYTYLGEAIQGLFLTYTNKGKDNFSISIYVYNKESDMIGRLRAHAYGRGVPKGDGSPHRSFSSVSKYYYAKNLRNDEQSHFSLLNNEEICKHLFFRDVSTKRRFTQYMGLSKRLTDDTKIYFEIITYNDLVVANSTAELNETIDIVINPLAQLLDSVDWISMEV